MQCLGFAETKITLEVVGFPETRPDTRPWACAMTGDLASWSGCCLVVVGELLLAGLRELSWVEGTG